MNASGSLGVWNPNPQFNVHVIGTADPASVTVDGIGIVGPNFMFRGRGTPSSPSAVEQNDGLLYLVAKGYGASGFSATGRANLSMYAAENWTDTAQGTYMTFKTTQIGTTTQTEKMHITETGAMVPPSDGVGSIGLNSQRWGLVRAVTVTPGDLVFENSARVTEDGGGFAFKKLGQPPADVRSFMSYGICTIHNCYKHQSDTKNAKEPCEVLCHLHAL